MSEEYGDFEWKVPLCSHGNVLLGCPESDCPEQDDEIAANQAMLDAWYARQAKEASEFVAAIVAPAAVVEEGT